jgi:hypothetical protein
MKKVGAISAFVSLLTALAVIPPLASAKPQAATTLKYTAIFRESQITNVDADDSGDESVGDAFVGNFVLRQGGKVRGHLEFRCDQVTSSPDRDLCTGVVHLDGRGEFGVSDVSAHDSERSKVMITGGTGEFGSAGGNGQFDFRQNRAHFTFKLK